MASAVQDEKRLKPLSPKDRQRIARMRWQKSRRQEIAYERQLRQVAKQVGAIVKGLAPDGVVKELAPIKDALERYAELLLPWAHAVGGRMISEAASRDEKAWIAAGRDMGLELRRQIAYAPIAPAMREMQRLQIDLIQSIPRDAAKRVHTLSVESLSTGRRAEDIAEDIRRQTHVSESKAMLIARTESGRASTTLSQVRAEHIGSVGYVWETAMDMDVRPSHAKMQGKVVKWDDPPTLDNLTGHAGALPNCRCWPRPLIPTRI